MWQVTRCDAAACSRSSILRLAQSKIQITDINVCPREDVSSGTRTTCMNVSHNPLSSLCAHITYNTSILSTKVALVMLSIMAGRLEAESGCTTDKMMKKSIPQMASILLCARERRCWLLSAVLLLFTAGSNASEEMPTISNTRAK